MKKLVNNKVFRIITKTIKYILIVFLLLFVFVVFLQRFSNNKVSFFNYRIFAVVTGSMAPKYNVGDILISKDVPAEDIKPGDTISYVGKNYNFEGKIITHEVVDILKDEDGKLMFKTKGINNLVLDPIVKEDQVYGVVKHKSPVLSFIYKIVNTTAGFYIFIILPLLYIVGSEVIFSLMDKEEKRRNKRNKRLED